MPYGEAMPFNDDMQLFFRPKLDFVLSNNHRNSFSDQLRPEWCQFLLYIKELGWNEALENYAKTEKNTYVVIAFDGKNPVGFATFQRLGETERFCLDSMYVDPLYRFKGIGGKMIGEVKSCIRHEGGATLMLIDASSYKMPWMESSPKSVASSVLPAISIYKKNGFNESEISGIKTCQIK
jgi:GNAT superfamily N-acetyltransferase